MKTLTVDVNRPTKRLGDLFGLFFEDLNHAADGGLYGELLQNRSFEFDPIDNKNYHALTAWEAVGEVTLQVMIKDPAYAENPHYLRMITPHPGSGVQNLGFGAGIPIHANEAYKFRCLARSEDDTALHILIKSMNDKVLAEQQISVQRGWKWYNIELTTKSTDFSSRLALLLPQGGQMDFDYVSLFPLATFRERENGLRSDIAQALADMKPKFMRFPGGCLTHDGKLEREARDGMYRWKNTVGPLEKRPARRNSWGYNQTFGLGFYEYFLFCEDIGAKALPVVSGGCDPHHRRFAEGDMLQGFIDDALDLIEFANGSPDTVWGGLRASMGHPEPFHLEYIAIGNEEVHQSFYDRLPLFVQAIRKRYPDIKIIGSAGPFAAGGEYERGWRSARETKVDLVDEHYYQAPEWYLANMYRYRSYPQDGPKVLLGEYASWGNTYENALTEAAYMTELQNAPSVGMACYAPMLCHKDYANWRPDMVWFDSHRIMLTPNYYVQSMFMRHQGDLLLYTEAEGLLHEIGLPPPPITGAVSLGANDTRMAIWDIVLETAGKTISLPDMIIEAQDRITLAETCAAPLVLTFRARRLEGKKGMRVFFGETDEDNRFIWGIGGWENQDCVLDKRLRGRGSCLTQSSFTVEDGQDYLLRLEIDGRTIKNYIDGVLFNHVEDVWPCTDALYHTASLDTATGDVILKAVNICSEPVDVSIQLDNMGDAGLEGTVEFMASHNLTAENTFDDPECITPTTCPFSSPNSTYLYAFPARSVTIFRLRKAEPKDKRGTP